MTDEMLALAVRNASDAGVPNVDFLKGVIEQIPLPADSVDVVISNCVINLSVDKPTVLTEIARVLRPGGRIGISDVVAEDDSPPRSAPTRELRRLHRRRALEGEYEAGLEAAGFVDVSRVHAPGRGRHHGAIVKATKTTAPGSLGLPVVQPAAKAGCC